MLINYAKLEHAALFAIVPLHRAHFLENYSSWDSFQCHSRYKNNYAPVEITFLLPHDNSIVRRIHWKNLPSVLNLKNAWVKFRSLPFSTWLFFNGPHRTHSSYKWRHSRFRANVICKTWNKRVIQIFWCSNILVWNFRRGCEKCFIGY